MSLKFSKIFLVVVVSLIFLIMCKNESTEPTNNPPEIQSISASPTTIKENQTTSLTCVATDEDGDNLTYSWSSENGTFPDGTSGSNVTWKAPDVKGDYLINVIVSDGKKTDESSKSITVEEAENPDLTIVPNSLEFYTNKNQLNFTIANNGTGIINYTIAANKSWITLSSTSGNVTSEIDDITVTVDRTGLTPGDYSGIVTVSSNVGNSEINILMSVPSNPTLSVSPQNLDFGSTQTSIKFNISNTGTGNIDYTVTDNKTWLILSSASGSVTTETDEISVTVDRSDLSPGDYTGIISITSDAGNIDIDVSMSVPSNPTLSVSPQNLDFGSTQTSMKFNISKTGTGNIDYTITDNKTWIILSSTSGSITTETDEISVTVDRSDLSPGDYTGIISITSDAGNIDIDVSMSVPSNPTLSVSPQTLDFSDNYVSRIFEISNSGTGSIDYTITDNKTWITLSSTSGNVTTETDEISVTVDRSNLSPGDYTGTVAINSNAGNMDVEIQINVPNQTGNIEGYVYQINTNNAISGVLVEAGSKSYTTGSDGYYRIDNISAGSITLKASKSDYELYQQTISVNANQTTQYDIYLTGSILSTNISGNVNDKDTNVPISNVKITIASQVDYTDINGHYQLPNVPQGLQSIKAEKEDYLTFNGEVYLSSNDKEFDINLEKLGTPCPGLPVVYYNNVTYNTVIIGAQCWLKENLNVGTIILGTEDMSDNTVIEKYCWGDTESNCNKYGGLYSWNEAIQYNYSEGAQGICPDGWHVPNYGELLSLSDFVNGNSNSLKSVGEGKEDGIGENTYGFSALLAGSRHYSGYFDNVLGGNTFFWSSSEQTAGQPYAMFLHDSDSQIRFSTYSTRSGFSLRCVKN